MCMTFLLYFLLTCTFIFHFCILLSLFFNSNSTTVPFHFCSWNSFSLSVSLSLCLSLSILYLFYLHCMSYNTVFHPPPFVITLSVHNISFHFCAKDFSLCLFFTQNLCYFISTGSISYSS